MSDDKLQTQMHEDLKNKARILGINPGNMGPEALRKAIEKAIEDKPVDQNNRTKVVQPNGKSMQGMTELQIRRYLQKEYMKMIRCRIYNNNPSKRDLHGEIIAVGNKYLGMYRKMIPFGENTENGYHIPLIVFNELKSRRYQQVMTKTVNGQIQVNRKMVPEYTLEVLPQLTRAELEELAVKQAAAERMGA